MCVAGFWRNLEWNGNAGNMDSRPYALPERGRTAGSPENWRLLHSFPAYPSQGVFFFINPSQNQQKEVIYRKMWCNKWRIAGEWKPLLPPSPTLCVMDYKVFLNIQLTFLEPLDLAILELTLPRTFAMWHYKLFFFLIKLAWVAFLVLAAKRAVTKLCLLKTSQFFDALNLRIPTSVHYTEQLMMHVSGHCGSD